MKKIKKYFLFVVLVILILVLVFLKKKYTGTDSSVGNSTKNQINSSKELLLSTTPTTTPIEVNNEQKNEITNIISDEVNDNVKINGVDYSNTKNTESDFTDNYDPGYFLQPYLPYQGEYFKINRYLKSDYLEILVKNDDNLDKAVTELESWLKVYGTDCNEVQCVYVFE